METPEYHYDSAERLFDRWNRQMWAEKGKPHLWFKAYEQDRIVVWRDVSYGRIKLVTAAGRAEGTKKVSVLGVTALDRNGEIAVYVDEAGASRSRDIEWSESEKMTAVPA